MIHPLLEAYGFECRPGPLPSLLGSDPPVEKTLGNILQGGGPRQQEEILEDEPDQVGPDAGQLLVRQPGNVIISNPDGPR